MRKTMLTVFVLGALSSVVACDDKPAATGTDGGAASAPSGSTAKKPVAAATEAGAGATATPPVATKMSVADIHAKHHLKDVEAFNSHDPKKMSAMYAEDGVLHAQGKEFKGAAAREEHLAAFVKMAPDVKIAMSRIFWNDKEAIAEWVMTGTNTGDTPMGKATGKKFGVRGASYITVNDEGLNTAEWLYFDSGTMFAQLAGAPIPIPDMPTTTEVHESKADAADQKATLELLGKIDAAESGGKEADAMALMADDVVMWMSWVPGGKEIKGKKDIGAMEKDMHATFPDGAGAHTGRFATDGGFAVSKGSFEGTQKGPLKLGDKTVPPTGTKVKLHALSVVQVKDGKVVHSWEYGDGMELLMQIGEPAFKALGMPMPGAPHPAGSGSAAPGASGATAPPGTAKPTTTAVTAPH